MIKKNNNNNSSNNLWLIRMPASFSFTNMSCNHTVTLSEYTIMHLRMNFASLQSGAMFCLLCNTNIVLFQMFAPWFKQPRADVVVQLQTMEQVP